MKQAPRNQQQTADKINFFKSIFPIILNYTKLAMYIIFFAYALKNGFWVDKTITFFTKGDKDSIFIVVCGGIAGCITLILLTFMNRKKRKD